jgi:NosR/NirI family transcriptional regulator, nitrous oxide reductase regulator
MLTLVALQQPAAADPWGFDDVQAVETWQDILRPQAVDLLLVSAFIIFALISFFRKSVPLKYAALVLAVGYMGLRKSYLISVTNLFQVIDWDFPAFKYSLAWYLFAVFTVVSTIVWGRLYCGRVCAFGALTQLMDRVLPS